jgi:hypothetical protein
MNTRKKLELSTSAIIGAIATAGLMTACGGGGSAGNGSADVAAVSTVAVTPPVTVPSGLANPGMLKASNVILNASAAAAKGKIIRVQANQLPDNVQVLASNVSIVNASNGLRAI